MQPFEHAYFGVAVTASCLRLHEGLIFQREPASSAYYSTSYTPVHADAHAAPCRCPQVTKLLNQKAASFEHANIYRVSVAAAPLATWVKANIK